MTRSDRRITLALLLVIIVALTVFFMEGPIYNTLLSGSEAAADSSDNADSAAHHYRSRRPYYYNEGTPPRPHLSAFNPNTADSTQLLRLGLSPRIVHNIYRYRHAGGVFHTPRDFARLYGLTLRQYRQLEPYIRIPQEEMAADHFFPDKKPVMSDDSARYPVKLQPTERILLNTADTTQLRRVPRVGAYFARKIVNYRERLGGFVSTDQLLEIEDFPKEALSYFLISHDYKIRKLRINELSFKALQRHPYIDFYQAKAIIDFRRLHGPIISLEQLHLSRDFTPEKIRRLEPYIEY